MLKIDLRLLWKSGCVRPKCQKIWHFWEIFYGRYFSDAFLNIFMNPVMFIGTQKEKEPKPSNKSILKSKNIIIPTEVICISSMWIKLNLHERYFDHVQIAYLKFLPYKISQKCQILRHFGLTQPLDAFFLYWFHHKSHRQQLWPTQ